MKTKQPLKRLYSTALSPPLENLLRAVSRSRKKQYMVGTFSFNLMKGNDKSCICHCPISSVLDINAKDRLCITGNFSTNGEILLTTWEEIRSLLMDSWEFDYNDLNDIKSIFSRYDDLAFEHLKSNRNTGVIEGKIGRKLFKQAAMEYKEQIRQYAPN